MPVDFLPRSACGSGWSPVLQFWYILANLLIAVSYFAIPVTLLRMLQKRLQPFQIPILKWQVVIWALFIFFCGGGHFVENVLVFWWPAYRFFTVWHWATAIVSVMAAVTFPGIVKALNQTMKHRG